MSQDQLPGTPDWMDLESPPPDSTVAFDRSDEAFAPGGWISLEGKFANQLGQTFSVRASAEEEYLRPLQEYAESLHIWMEVMPTSPELEEYFAELRTLAAEVGDHTIEGTISRARRETPNLPIIFLETYVISDQIDADAVVWAATWTWHGRIEQAWHGPKKVKMQVVTGYADLRGVSGGAPAVRAVGETQWENASGHCSVRGLETRNQYRLNAGWIPD